MKKLIMSAIMCIALMGSTTVIAQDATPKKTVKAKTECTKKDDKKSCCTKDKKDDKKCTQKDSKKSCCTKKEVDKKKK